VPTRLIALDRIDARDVDRWRDLAARACEPNPFFEADFILPGVATLSRGVSLAVAERDGRWLACLPVRRLPRGVLRTWCSAYCFLGTPLVDAGDPEEALAALLDARFLVLERQRAEGPVAEALQAALRRRRMVTVYEQAYERAALERREAPDYLDAMRSHHRREFKRQHRRLAEHLGAELEVRDCSADDSAPERFIALERSGWKGRGGTALGSDVAHADFFREVCARFRAAGRLQMLETVAGDRTVAMKCNLAAGDAIFCFKIAHDEELGRFSPGVQLEIAHVTRFHEDREERFADSCADPDNAMINRLWPDRRRIVTLAVSRPGPQAALSRHGVRTYRSLRSRERRAPSLT
jgi:CelD/BcsL family acetyltransferase involved in cellulose biosynthesis